MNISGYLKRRKSLPAGGGAAVPGRGSLARGRDRFRQGRPDLLRIRLGRVIRVVPVPRAEPEPQAISPVPRDDVQMQVGDRLTDHVVDEDHRAIGAEPVFDRRPTPPADPFDNFCQDRDRREDLSTSGKYVSRDMPGYADLDANGTWRTA